MDDSDEKLLADSMDSDDSLESEERELLVSEDDSDERLLLVSLDD